MYLGIHSDFGPAVPVGSWLFIADLKRLLVALGRVLYIREAFVTGVRQPHVRNV